MNTLKEPSMVAKLKDLIKKIFNHTDSNKGLANNTLWMAGGLLGRFGLQIVYFIILTRSLKPGEYGMFTGSYGLITMLAPFVAWGCGGLLNKYVSRDPSTFSDIWGMTVSISFLSGIVISVISFAIGLIFFPLASTISILLPMAVGVFFGEVMANLSGQAFQATEKISRSSFLNFFIGITRLGSVLILFILPVEKTAANWAVLFMLSGLLSGCVGLLMVRRELGWGKFNPGLMRGKWREGFFFAIGVSAQGAYNDIDKSLLVKLSTSAVAGIYSAAYKLMDAAFIPIRALIYSSYPIFFKKGENGSGDAHQYARRLLPWTAGMGLLMGVGMVVCAPLIPFLLGSEYAETSRVLLWLAPIPVFRAFSYLAANSLAGSDYQGVRSANQIGIAILNLVLNLIWIPKYGWLGAAWSSLIADGLLAVFLWTSNSIINRIESRKLLNTR
jgi:O-antigen/teichoic acid export membrane protein